MHSVGSKSGNLSSVYLVVHNVPISRSKVVLLSGQNSCRYLNVTGALEQISDFGVVSITFRLSNIPVLELLNPSAVSKKRPSKFLKCTPPGGVSCRDPRRADASAVPSALTTTVAYIPQIHCTKDENSEPCLFVPNKSQDRKSQRNTSGHPR